MARPRYGTGEKTAREKLDDAFWAYLRERPFDKVTVADIVKRAGVNRNTFYYHYEDMNDLARTVVRETVLEPELILFMLEQIMRGSSSEVLSRIPRIDRRVEHVCLLAGRNSTAELRQMLRDTLEEVWAEALEVDIEALDLEGRLAMEFALGGFLAVVAYRADSGIDFDLRAVFEYGISRDAMQLLRHIPEARGKLPA